MHHLQKNNDSSLRAGIYHKKSYSLQKFSLSFSTDDCNLTISTSMYLIGSFWLLLGAICYAQDLVSPPCATKVLEYATHTLPLHGKLQQSDAFVYVDIDDDYIHKLLEFIKEEGFQSPPYFRSPNKVGAHITLLYPDELRNSPPITIQEINQDIDFTLQECLFVHPPKWEEMQRICIITVQSLQLDELRKKYGFPQKAHDFHITIGVTPK